MPRVSLGCHWAVLTHFAKPVIEPVETRDMTGWEMSSHRIVGSFVARIWLEGEAEGEPIWRGHIQHVQGTEETYFRDLSEMRAFLERVSGVSVPADRAARGTGFEPGRGNR